MSTVAPANGRPATARWWTILRKEFREIFRDRRTILSVVVGPLLITPGLFAIVGMAIQGRVDQVKTQTYSVGIVGAAATSRLAQQIGAIKGIRPVSLAPAEAEAAIRRHRVSLAIVLPPDADERVSQGRPVPVDLMQDAGDESSLAATGRVSTFFSETGRRIAEKRLESRGLPANFARPFQVDEKPIKSGGGAGMLFLAQMLPYMLVLAAFSGAIYASFDQVAGEKERGTLETLLVSPASRRDIVLGKFGAVVGVCVVSSILSIVGLAIPFFSGMAAFAWLTKGGLHLAPVAALVVLVMILPLSVLFAGMLLAVSTFSRNQKEAQTYLGTLFPVILVPALFSIFVGTNASPALALVPILNASLIIKQALTGTYSAGFVALAFGASALYAGLALAFATRLFQKESVLTKA